MKYTILADLHLHQWSNFSTITEEGLRSRFAEELSRIRKIFDEALLEKRTVVIAGDIFHQRGTLNTTTFNHFFNLVNEYTIAGLNIFMLAGNHDAETKDAKTLRTAIDSLEAIGVSVCTSGFWRVKNDFANIIMFAWYNNPEELKEAMTLNQSKDRECICFIHADTSGIIPEVNGLDPEWLDKLDYRTIFCGHIHQFKKLTPKIYSVGALSQHSWRDKDSLAGYIKYDTVTGVVEHIETDAPKFVEINFEDKIDDLLEKIKDNYITLTIKESTNKTIEEIKQALIKYGAKDFLIKTLNENTSSKREVQIKDFSVTGAMEHYLNDRVGKGNINLTQKGKIESIARDIIKGDFND